MDAFLIIRGEHFGIWIINDAICHFRMALILNKCALSKLKTQLVTFDVLILRALCLTNTHKET